MLESYLSVKIWPAFLWSQIRSPSMWTNHLILYICNIKHLSLFSESLISALNESERLLGELSVLTRRHTPKVMEYSRALQALEMAGRRMSQLHGDCHGALTEAHSLTTAETCLKIQAIQTQNRLSDPVARKPIRLRAPQFTVSFSKDNKGSSGDGPSHSKGLNPEPYMGTLYWKMTAWEHNQKGHRTVIWFNLQSSNPGAVRPGHPGFLSGCVWEGLWLHVDVTGSFPTIMLASFTQWNILAHSIKHQARREMFGLSWYAC